MTIAETLLPEFDREVATTRRVLERVPEGAFEWRPHPRSMTLGALASHLGELGHWGESTIDRTGVDLEQVGHPPGWTPPSTRAALLEAFDRQMAAARGALVGKTDSELLAPWTLRQGTREFFTMPKATCLRTFVMNHLVHHRGQLTVYLRLLDVPLPSIYGPSADEQPS